MARKPDSLEALARELALADGLDPEQRVDRPGQKPWPAWCSYRDKARALRAATAAEEAGRLASGAEQPPQYAASPLTVYGTHDAVTLAQMQTCMKVGNVVAGVICADGHLGYAQPVGGVIAYEDQISISGVGFDIACGNMAVRLDTRYADIAARAPLILSDIRSQISFGVGRSNDERPDHPVFDDADAWRDAGMADYLQKARAQLGTVGSGNHYVDLFHDPEGHVWIGVHFGSRGLGHTTATRALKLAGGRDGIHVPPAVVDVDGEIGQRYLAGTKLAGRYAYAGREWVVEKVRSIIGGTVTKTVHNHHNYAWRERHMGRDLWVVRKGATPAMPGQEGFIGGSMCEEAVIVEGVDSPAARAALYSTVHGAGRIRGRKDALRSFTRAEMEDWLRQAGVLLSGGDLDESPMAYKRLPDVLALHEGTIRITHRLKPFAVAMAGPGEFDPWKD